jgi:flagellar protein FliO/FliZ
MKRILRSILLSIAVIVAAAACDALCLSVNSAVYAQDRKKPAAKPTAPPRQITDFTGKDQAKDSSKGAKPAEAAQPSGQAVAAPAEGDKAGSALFTPYEVPKEEETSYGWLLFQALFVVALIGVGFYFFIRFISKRTGFTRVGGTVVQTLAVTPVGPNKTIQVIDISGRLLVIGVTDNNISLISEVTGKDDIDRIRLQASKSTPVEQHGFQDFLSEQIGSLVSFIGKTRKGIENKKKIRPRHDEEYLDDDRIDYLREQRERLKRMNGYHHDEEK